LEQVVKRIGGSDEALMKVMMAFEFGLNGNDDRSPLTAMLMSGGLFISGAIPTFLPFFFTDDTHAGLIASAVLSATGMFVIGALKTFATRGSWLHAGLENLVIGAVGGALSFGVGSLYDFARDHT
jgi:VIT1/CCC1 family predicted Fe2+/Mn2+ transporter